MTRRRSAILAIALSLGLVLGACGDDSTPAADDDTSETGGGGFTVTISADGIEMPDEVTGGVVEVTLEAEAEESEVNFSQVTPGTTERQFQEAIAGMMAGGPIPDFIQAETGVIALGGGGRTATLILPEGDYIAWSERAGNEEGEGEEGEGEGGPEEGATTTSQALEGDADPAEGEGEGGPSPDDFLTATFTATPGEAGDLPSAPGGEITARDYTFDIDVAGEGDIVFRNAGPDQFHHVVLFNFGDLETSTVEENLPAFLESEDEPPPAFRDVDFQNLSAGVSTVLSPGLATTASANLEPGNTYAAVCFISDRTGGPPHALGHKMYTVFNVE